MAELRYEAPESLSVAVSLLAGASGYVLKEIRGNELVSAIRRIASGESHDLGGHLALDGDPVR